MAKFELKISADTQTELINKLEEFLTNFKKIEIKTEDFKTKLSLWMGRFGLSSNDVIEATGINQSVFSKIKTGEREPSNESYMKLVTYFDKLHNDSIGYIPKK